MSVQKNIDYNEFKKLVDNEKEEKRIKMLSEGKNNTTITINTENETNNEDDFFEEYEQENNFFSNLNDENIKTIDDRVVFRIVKNNLISIDILNNIIFNNDTIKLTKLDVICKKMNDKVDGIYNIELYDKKIELFFTDIKYTLNTKYKSLNINILGYENTFPDIFIKNIMEHLQVSTSLEYRCNYFFIDKKEVKYLPSNIKIDKNENIISTIKYNNKNIYKLENISKTGTGNILISIEGVSIYDMKMKLKINLIELDIKIKDKPKKTYENPFK